MITYYHGSSKELPVGTVLKGRGEAYATDWEGTDFFNVLERYRPEDKLSHQQAVFMVGDPDDIDLAGGATEWCFEVKPEGDVSRHDLNWSSEISMLVSEGKTPDSIEVTQAAANYWNGVPHHNESVWEYLVEKAEIVRCEPYEDFEVSTSRGLTP